MTQSEKQTVILPGIAPDKVVVEASYDDSGCYQLSVRLNQDVIMREDIVATIEALFTPGRIPVPMYSDRRVPPPATTPQPSTFTTPAPSPIRPFAPGEAERRAALARLAAPVPPPSEADTQIMPVVGANGRPRAS